MAAETDHLPDLLPLSVGASGDAVRDLQARLRRGGFLGGQETAGDFDPATQLAVLAFQDRSGLEATGICDTSTWSALVEAGYELGDRLLYHRSPMLRGDDVAALQRRLSELGFHGGRVDGIFGPDTEKAVASFQRNTGLVTDGVAGPDVLAQVRRLGPGTGSVTKAVLTEQLDLLRAPRHLHGARIAVAEPGTLPAFVRSITTRLDNAGAQTLAVHHPEGSAQAAEANRFDAHCFLGWTSRSDVGACLSYYHTNGYESAGGRHLAEVLARILAGHGFPDPVRVRGMRLPVLRETRMPALWCELGPPTWIVEHAATLAGAIAEAVSDWIADPLADSDDPD